MELVGRIITDNEKISRSAAIGWSALVGLSIGCNVAITHRRLKQPLKARELLFIDYYPTWLEAFKDSTSNTTLTQHTRI